MSEVNVQKTTGCNEIKINVKPVPANPVVIENSYRGIDYNVLRNKPKIEGNELIGDKTAKELLGFDKTDMDETIAVAQGAEEVANASNAKATEAYETAAEAKQTAEAIDGKATLALTNSNTAVNTANSAKQTAEGIDDKATQALANSATALETATQAKNTADSYQGQITTLRNDVDDLGDQVAAIEGKIPAEATTANQLADKEFVTTITDELAADITALDADVQKINLIKWVDTLPATGETKYLYAIPRNELDKDGKRIAVLYLWDGTEWRGAGGISIDPGAGIDGIKGDYCTTYGIIDAPNGILTNPSGMEVVLKQGVVLQLAGQDIKTTISGDMAHTITSTADCDLFYVSGTASLMEVAQIVWSRIEPDNGQAGVLAWWNPDNKKWKFKSNNTGNVWAEAVATPVAHIHTNGTTITRIDHIGYRVLDDEVYALKADLNERADKQLSNTNLITNCILSAPNGVMQVSSTDPYTLVANKGLKVALANGYNADGTPKSEVITLDNDISITIPSTSNYNWPTYVILAKPVSGGDFRWLIPHKMDFSVVDSTPENIPTNWYKVWYNKNTNFYYEHNSGVISEYKGVLLGSSKFVDSKFTDTVPYKPIQLSLEGLGDYVVESQINADGSWYREYKSGWLEQGGQIANIPTGNDNIYNLLKPYANANYTIFAQCCEVPAWGGDISVSLGIGTRTTTTFKLLRKFRNVGGTDTIPALWEAKGMGANK